jgi:hypothetical protein
MAWSIQLLTSTGMLNFCVGIVTLIGRDMALSCGLTAGLVFAGCGLTAVFFAGAFLAGAFFAVAMMILMLVVGSGDFFGTFELTGAHVIGQVLRAIENVHIKVFALAMLRVGLNVVVCHRHRAEAQVGWHTVLELLLCDHGCLLRE